MAIPKLKGPFEKSTQWVYDEANDEWIPQTGTSSGSSVTSYTASTPYAVRIDEAASSLTYIGYATPGSSTASAVWQIKRIDDSATPDMTLLWADGNSNFDNVWDNRASLSYS